MIKKEYIKPEVKDIKILLPTILAGSSEEVSDEEIVEENDIASLDADFE